MTDNGEIVIGGDATDIPPATYPGRLKALETLASAKFGGDFRKWIFELDSGSIVSGATSLNTNSKSKGGRWLAALLGRVPDKGETVNPIGRPCLVVVGLRDDWPNVTDVLPPLVAASVNLPAPGPAPVSVAPVGSGGPLSELP